MSTRTWHKGPPPFPGWWNASWYQLPNNWRWYDGRAWSESAVDDDADVIAANQAKNRENAADQNAIEWTDYWPENARVPRIDPRSKT